MKRYHFLDERKFRYFCQGLTLDAQDMANLDKVLCSLDKVRKLPSKIVAHNGKHGFGSLPSFPGPQIIINLEKTFSENGRSTSLSLVSEHSNILNATPGLHIHLRSPSLDIPQRVEIPLRYVLKGLPDIEGTHMIYLHTLEVKEGPPFVYYGITKRGWMKRFNEHMAGALKRESRLVFHKTLRDAILGRMIELGNDIRGPDREPPPTLTLAGNHHVVCAAGLNEEQALEAEEYLVGKHSFGHEGGLNMIPGGKAGVAHLHRLNILPANRRGILDQDREEAMDQFLKDHPRRGIPNPQVAEHWKDSAYASRIICAGVHRLSVDQVIAIRRNFELGLSAESICQQIKARNVPQVLRVIEGKTYQRIVGPVSQTGRFSGFESTSPESM